jgi:hypothetical protein
MAAGLQDRLLSRRRSVLMVARNRSCLTDLRKPEPLAPRVTPPHDAVACLAIDDDMQLEGEAGHGQGIVLEETVAGGEIEPNEGIHALPFGG